MIRFKQSSDLNFLYKMFLSNINKNNILVFFQKFYTFVTDIEIGERRT